MTTRTRTLKELTDAGIPRSTIASGAGVAAWRPSALLSHRTAAWLYGWLPEPVDIEATIPRGLRVTPPDWLRLYRRELSRRGLHLEANHPIGPYVGDFVDEVARIVVEVDGREFHSEPEVFRHDRRRRNWLGAGGMDGWRSASPPTTCRRVPM
ncbi:endonuclease domain-containing protein [Rhodococcus opacus]|uniref:DUF559 domain-containing protein n=1 Tax=Rhodococcus opacus (strain B4) TaxID=632772 RepID=C1B1B7_RHOOB|nr:DUF559 domain-containing protein [Rhodococcus opacus]BAH54612.1 hypothetical protein ROP_63650 [Rhodococcus opacus B4]